MIDTKTVQRTLAARGINVAVDGVDGPRTKIAIRAALADAGIVAATGRTWTDERCRVAYEQLLFRDAGLAVGQIDGLIGPQTRYAQEKWQDLQRSIPSDPVARATFPRQSEVPAYYGAPGQNLVRLMLPYPFRLAWATGTTVTSIQVHAKVSESARLCLAAELAHFGPDKIRELGLDLFGGCYADRAMRGGSAKSMHAWGIAIDRDPTANPLRADHRTARFARAEYEPVHAIWEAAGWINLGRERDFDWMHWQAARL